MKGLELRNLEIKFGEGRITTDSVSVAPGEWLRIDAPSGFGKSTLLRGILGLQKMSGEFRLNGREMNEVPVHQRNFGMVFQDHLLLPHLDAFENSLLGIRLRRKVLSADLDRAMQAFQDLGLESRIHAPIQELSGGERQRVAVLRAVLAKPDLLLLDEAFRGLDSELLEKTRKFVDQFLSTNPVPVVWITHQNEFEPHRSKIWVGGELQHGYRHFQNDSR